MDSKILNQEEVGLIKALGQEQKQESAVYHLKKLKDEFSKGSKQGQEPFSSLENLRIEIWKKNPEAQVKSISKNHITFEGISLQRVPSPPKGYAYKGGAARLALFELLGRAVGTKAPRDLDIVRIGQGKNTVDDLIASKFMEEDFKRGHGVEIIDSIDRYMASRDLTINEILYFEDRIICSLGCLKDSINFKLRFTEWCFKKDKKPEAKVYMKALRFVAESHIEGSEYELISTKNLPTITAFDIALQLERCVNKSSRTAQKFCELAIQHSLLPQKYLGKSIGDITLYLLSLDKSLKKKFNSLFPKNTHKNNKKIKF